MPRSEDLKRLDQIAQAIYDKKGGTIIAIDVRQFSTLTEYFLVAEGNVPRHVAAIAKEVVETQEKAGHSAYHIEGLKEADWVVIDFGHIVVHLFEPSLRERYSLETLWKQGQIVDLKINLSTEEKHEK